MDKVTCTFRLSKTAVERLSQLLEIENLKIEELSRERNLSIQKTNKSALLEKYINERFESER